MYRTPLPENEPKEPYSGGEFFGGEHMPSPTYWWKIVQGKGGDGSQIVLGLPNPNKLSYQEDRDIFGHSSLRTEASLRDHCSGLLVSTDVQALKESETMLSRPNSKPGIVDTVNLVAHLTPGHSEIAPLILPGIIGGVAAQKLDELSGQFVSHLFETDLTHITGAGVITGIASFAGWWALADFKEGSRRERLQTYKKTRNELSTRLRDGSVFIPDTGISISSMPRLSDGSREKDRLAEWSSLSYSSNNYSSNNKNFMLGEFVKTMLEKHPSPGSFWAEISSQIQTIIENSHQPYEIDPEENRAIIEQIEAEATGRREEVDTFSQFIERYTNLQKAIDENQNNRYVRELLMAVSEELRVSGARQGETLTVESLKKANAVLISLQRKLPDMIDGKIVPEDVYQLLRQSIAFEKSDTSNLHFPPVYEDFLSEPRFMAERDFMQAQNI